MVSLGAQKVKEAGNRDNIDVSYYSHYVFHPGNDVGVSERYTHLIMVFG